MSSKNMFSKNMFTIGIFLIGLISVYLAITNYLSIYTNSIGLFLIAFGFIYLVSLKYFTNYLSLHKYSFYLGSLGAFLLLRHTKTEYEYISTLISAISAYLVYFLAATNLQISNPWQ